MVETEAQRETEEAAMMEAEGYEEIREGEAVEAETLAYIQELQNVMNTSIVSAQRVYRNDDTTGEGAAGEGQA